MVLEFESQMPKKGSNPWQGDGQTHPMLSYIMMSLLRCGWPLHFISSSLIEWLMANEDKALPN
jgi:hypothetical protein